MESRDQRHHHRHGEHQVEAAPAVFLLQIALLQIAVAQIALVQVVALAVYYAAPAPGAPPNQPERDRRHQQRNRGMIQRSPQRGVDEALHCPHVAGLAERDIVRMRRDIAQQRHIAPQARPSDRDHRQHAQPRRGGQEAFQKSPLPPQQKNQHKRQDELKLEQSQPQDCARSPVAPLLQRDKRQRIHQQHHNRRLPLIQGHAQRRKQQPQRQVCQFIARRRRVRTQQPRQSQKDRHIDQSPEQVRRLIRQRPQRSQQQRLKRRMLVNQRLSILQQRRFQLFLLW